MSNAKALLCICSTVVSILSIVFAFLYTYPNLPKLSIEEFSIPAFNKTSDHTAGDIYFDLKLRNMNKAIGLYYDDPFTLAFSYYPIQEPYQKYVWESSIPSFYQGNGKTKHIKTLMGNHLPLPSMVVDEEEDTRDLAPTVPPLYHVRSLLRNHLHLPSMMVDEENDSKGFTETRQDVQNELEVGAKMVSFRVDVMVNYRFKYWFDLASTNELEVGANVKVDANTGERVSKGSITLVKSDAAAGGPLLLMVLFTSFLFMSI